MPHNGFTNRGTAPLLGRYEMTYYILDMNNTVRGIFVTAFEAQAQADILNMQSDTNSFRVVGE